MNAFNSILYLVVYLHIVVDCVELSVEVNRVVPPLYSAVGSGQVKMQVCIIIPLKQHCRVTRGVGVYSTCLA